MDKAKNILKIPDEFEKYFWDVDFKNLNLEKHKKFVMERLLNYGTFDTFKWIFRTFDNEDVKQFLAEKGKYTLSKNSFYFWGKIAKEKSLWQSSSN
ncbi:MAG: DUF6922 domain-containing protein [Ignavibacteriaceae bacterium]